MEKTNPTTNNVILSHDMMEKGRVNVIRTTDNIEIGHFTATDEGVFGVANVTSIKGIALPISPVLAQQAIEWLLAEKRKHDKKEADFDNTDQLLLF